MILKSFKQFLTEEVYGNLMLCYHRTRDLDTVKTDFVHGMRSGAGDMYGRGIYATYDLASQDTQYMTHQYGDYVVKCKVNLFGFIIFDYDIAKKVYGKNYNLKEQYKILRIPVTPEVEKISTLCYEYAGGRWGKFTSELALKLAKSLQHKVNGIVYTGSHDGHCILAYDERLMIPMAVTKLGYTEELISSGGEVEEDEEEESDEYRIVKDEPNWFKLDSSHTIKDYMKRMGSIKDKNTRPSIITLPSKVEFLTNLNNDIVLNWEKANELCKAMKLHNKTDWRLPTLEEAREIVAYIKKHVADFPDAKYHGFVWTSDTTQIMNTFSVFGINITGKISMEDPKKIGRVWAVRKTPRIKIQ
jgi:hypothetical protein